MSQARTVLQVFIQILRRAHQDEVQEGTDEKNDCWVAAKLTKRLCRYHLLVRLLLLAALR